MRSFFPFGPQMMMGEEDFMDIEIDPEDAMAIMEAMGEHMQEKLLDADFFNGKCNFKYLTLVQME